MKNKNRENNLPIPQYLVLNCKTKNNKEIINTVREEGMISRTTNNLWNRHFERRVK